jgi:RHH-type rel operon transcriptional repressor/antitoxin RelB
MTTISLPLPDDISLRLQKLAQQTGQSEVYCIVEALQEYLDDMEDLCIAETRWKNLQAGRTHAIPLDEIAKRYGMDS